MTAPGPPPSITEPTILTQPSRDGPKLAWPTRDDRGMHVDCAWFPEEHKERARYAVGEFGAWSENFMEAIEHARDKVWIVDPFLLKKISEDGPTFFSVFEEALYVTGAQRVHMITEAKDGYREQCRALKQLELERQSPPRSENFSLIVRVGQTRRHPVRLPHDRFAVVDDELWHWGANVGGTHADVNAYSRGWSALDTKAEEYFNRIWNCAETVVL